MSQNTRTRRTFRGALASAALLCGLLGALSALGGCHASGPGLTNAPPPQKGGPPAASQDRPPGEVKSPMTR